MIVEADLESTEVIRVAGDPNHFGSRGFVCPKSQGLRRLRQDPDQLRKRLLREGDAFREISWEESLDIAAEGIRAVRQNHGDNAMGLYTGNPQAHIAALQMAVGGLLRVMPSLYTNSGSIDCCPRFLVDAYLYGNICHVPFPDVDRTLFIIGQIRSCLMEACWGQETPSADEATA